MSEELTKEDAYKILKLDPSTPRRRVKFRYENLMRDAKFNDSVDTILITDAFDKIMEVEWTKYDPSVYSEKGLNKKKISNMEWVVKDMSSGDSDIYLLSSEFAKFLSYEGAVKDLAPFLDKADIPLSDENIVWWYSENGDEIASAYRFGKSEILTKCVSGFMPDCFIIPFRADISELTDVMIDDLIHGNAD